MFLPRIIYLILNITACQSPSKGPLRHIIVLHSLASDETYYPDLNRNIAEQLALQGIPAELNFFYLNCELLNAQQEETAMCTFLDSVAHWKLHLILVNEDQATYTLLSCNHPLANFRLFFAGLIFRTGPLMDQYPNVTGKIDMPDYETNIRLIEKIAGKVRNIVNYDETFLGQQAHRLFMNQIESLDLVINYNRLSKIFPNKFDSLYNERFNHYLLGPNMPCPDSMMVDFIPFRLILGRDVFGQLSGIERFYTYLNIKHDYMTIPLGKYFEVPTFTSIVEGFGYSNAYLGGYFTSYEIQAQEQAALAARILNEGVAPSEIPIQKSKKEYLFDWDEIQRFHIDLDILPEGARIVDMPFYEQHRILFISLEIITALFILSIITYLFFFIPGKLRVNGWLSIN